MLQLKGMSRFGDYMDYSVKIDEFEGPLDLLLHLVSLSNIDIYNISIDEITKQYLAYINKMEELNINIASSYLVMAAELMVLKSKSLLPGEKIEEIEETDEEITRENLIHRLLEYQKYKEVTKELKILEQERKKIYTKAPSRLNDIVDVQVVNDTDVTVEDLLKAFEIFLKRKNMEKPLNTKVTNKEYSVKKRKQKVKEYLMVNGRTEFINLFEAYNKSYIIVTFLAILELTKENEIIINQETNFDKIYLELKVK